MEAAPASALQPNCNPGELAQCSRVFRLDAEDARVLKHAEADGISPSEVVRRGLRIVAAQYYGPGRRRPPKVGLFVCTDPEPDSVFVITAYTLEGKP